MAASRLENKAIVQVEKNILLGFEFDPMKEASFIG